MTARALCILSEESERGFNSAYTQGVLDMKTEYSVESS